MLGGASRRVVVVAPFIRSVALDRLLSDVSPDVEATIVTRWRLADLVAGASDLAVFDVARQREAGLYLRQDLHAKFFAADDRCLVGSANVTAAALGWREPANLELLIPVKRTVAEVVAFEAEVLRGAVPASRALHDCLARLLESDSLRRVEGTEAVQSTGDVEALAPDWIPSARNPEELYAAYSGESDVSRVAREAMGQELKTIGVPPGLSREEFRTWVGASLSGSVLVGSVLRRIDEVGQMTEADLAEVMGGMGANAEEREPREVLEVLERWLTCFLPTEYETARDSVKLVRSRRL